MRISCAAIICVRNEEPYIYRTLSYLTHQNIEVVVIDHESTDETMNICQEFLGCGLLYVDRLEWKGEYDQTAQLSAKAKIVDQLKHDWVIHTDVDEWLQSPIADESLLQGIDRIDRSGFNVINFEEFIFLPEPGQHVDVRHHEKQILGYYFFAPFTKRLMRGWKRSAHLQNIASGGHKLSGASVRCAPENFILRHYIVLSQEHAVSKYVGRVFSQQDLARNWHGNRLKLTAEALTLPAPEKMKKLPRWDSIKFDRSEPREEHFWQWQEETSTSNQ